MPEKRIRKPRILSRGILLAVMGLGVWAIGIFPQGCSRKPPLLIAVAGPLSGEQQQEGLDVLRGVEAAVSEWNAKGGVAGRRLALVRSDDHASPKEALGVARKLVEVSPVAVIGHLNSDCSIAAAPIYHEAKILQISPASTFPGFTEMGYETLFRTCGRDDEQGLVAARFTGDVLKKGRIAVLHDRTRYGENLAGEFLRNLGPETGVVLYEGLNQEAKDPSPLLTKLKAERVEVVFYGGMYPEAAELAKALKTMNPSPAFIAGDGVFHPEFLRRAGGAAEGTFVTFGPTVEGTARGQALMAALRRRYEEVGPYAASGYEAASVLFQALGQSSGEGGEALAQAIRHGTFEALSGTIRFDYKGDLTSAPYVIYTVKQGRFIPHETGT